MKKRISAMVMSLLMIFCSCNQADSSSIPTESESTDTESTETGEITAEPLTKHAANILENTDSIFRTIGRTYTRDNGLACDFSATGIEFTALCEGDVYLYLTSTNTAYLTVYIDGERSENRIKVSTITQRAKIAEDLERGEHTIMVVNQSQFPMATLILNEVMITGDFSKKPAYRELFFEFYGDSILNGSNIYLGGTTPKTSDATRSFGWTAAQLLDADCSIIGRGGLGLTASSFEYSMLDIYDLCGSIELGDVPKYDFARKPDAVIIELGINDYVNGGLSSQPDVYAAGVREFIGNLREKYGHDVPVVWVYGYRTDEIDFWSTTKETLDALISEGDANIFFCKVSKAYLMPEQGGDGYHPDVEMAYTFGTEVAAYLKDLLKIQ